MQRIRNKNEFTILVALNLEKVHRALDDCRSARGSNSGCSVRTYFVQSIMAHGQK